MTGATIETAGVFPGWCATGATAGGKARSGPAGAVGAEGAAGGGPDAAEDVEALTGAGSRRFARAGTFERGTVI